jgi:hypothetical protein
MKLTALSKSVRSIGLMTMLSVTVATAQQQPVQAQFGVLAKDSNGACVPLPNGIYYQEFGGITFSSEQKTAYRRIEAKIKERFKVIVDNGREVVIPDGGLTVEFKPGISTEKANEINDASVKMARDNLSTAMQVKLLTKKYGEYAKFSLPKATIYTPEQIAEGKRISRDLEAQTMTILTSEQQKIYRANLALQQRIRACDPLDTPFDRYMSPLPY